VNPVLLAPKEDGLQFCRLKEDEFVRRALLTPGVQPEKAKLLYFRLWALHIDSQALPPLTVASDEPASANTAPKKPQKSKIVNPGMFFRLDEPLREDEVEMVMVMAPEHMTTKRGGKDDMRYICAVICLAVGVQGAYELYVANRRVVKTAGLGEEIVMNYDSQTRYYYIEE